MADMDDVLEPASEFGSVLKDGERRTVTVLFSDMKGFTALSEKSDPEEMDQLMGRVFTRFEAIIRRHGGYILHPINKYSIFRQKFIYIRP